MLRVSDIHKYIPPVNGPAVKQPWIGGFYSLEIFTRNIIYHKTDNLYIYLMGRISKH